MRLPSRLPVGPPAVELQRDCYDEGTWEMMISLMGAWPRMKMR
jgi:hypothetical protein